MSSTDKGYLHYSMVIQWSDENQAYIVSIPEFSGNFMHGDPYEEAVKQGQDLIESLIMWAEQDGKPLPYSACLCYALMQERRVSHTRTFEVEISAV